MKTLDTIESDLKELRRECGYDGSDEFQDDPEFVAQHGDGSSVDGLINYKNALEDRLRDALARLAKHEPPEGTTLACPKCGGTDLASADVIPGTCRGTWTVDTDGERTFDGDGYTDVHWNGQKPTDLPAYCTGCDWQGAPGELKGPTAE